MSALLLALVAVPTQAQASGVLVDVSDPAGDDRGPGTYTYPIRPAYPPRVFDLRGFEVRLEGEQVVFTATFASVLRPPSEQPRRTAAIEIALDNQIYVKHVDVYIRTGVQPGVQQGLPGRKIGFTSGWHRAVVMTPRPYLMRSLLKQWPHQDRVLVPDDLRAMGRKVIARLPRSAFGDAPPQSWGFAVTVSGALWENQFDSFPQAPKDYVPNALTMPVRPVADRRWFGGGDFHNAHPQIIDMLAPTAAEQYRVLKAARPGEPALLPWLVAQ